MTQRTPGHSEQVTLELAALPAAAPMPNVERHLALVVASNADVGAYVSDALHERAPLDVVAIGSVAAALDAAARRRPAVLVVAHTERAVLRHLPGVPAVLLSEDVPAADATYPRRLAALVVLRGAFRADRLLEVVSSLLADPTAAAEPNDSTAG